MFLSNLSIKRPVFAAVMMLALVTFGIFSYRRLAIDMFPDVEIPYITIITIYPGASPETVEREVSKRVEESVNPISGVKHLGSISREGVSTVWVEFALEVDVAEAVQEARVKVSAIRDELPDDISEPIVEKIDFSSLPVISLAVRSERLSPRELTDFAEKTVQRRVENIEGVGKVDLVGTSFREVSVELLPERLEALGLGVDDVIGGLRTENVNFPVGRLNRDDTEQPLRVAGKPSEVEGYKTLVIAEIEGRAIALGDVARVVDGVEEQRTLALVDGKPAVALDVIKQSGANTVGVVDAVREEVAALQKDIPEGTVVEIVRDGSISIRESVRDVQETLLIGAFLTVLIVFFFLNSWRSTVITGLTLPIAVISSFIIMRVAGMSLNTMTLMALSLSIGLLIDDAIVVRENIVRHLEHGEDHFKAARDGTTEIGLAVLATTMSIIAVFVPVAFMGGIVGRFFRDFGITVAFAVLVSLFVSFTLDPMLSSRWYDPDVARTGKRHRVARALDRFNAWFDRTADRYRGLIAWSLDHRKTVMGIAALAFVAGLVVFGLLESEFMPGYDQSEFQVAFVSSPDASLEETEGRLRAVLAVLEGVPEVERTYATIGAGDDGTVRDGRVFVKLVEKGERRRSQDDVEQIVREMLLGVPGILSSVMAAESMGPEKPLQVGFRGENLDQLKAYAAELKNALYDVPGIVDLESSLETETPEYRLVVDQERAADAGLNTGRIVQTLSALVGGQAVTTFEESDGDAVPVRVRLPEALRADISQVEALRLSVGDRGEPLALVPIGDLLRHEVRASASQIIRQDLSREVVVSANLEGVPLGTAAKAARDAAAKLDMAPGYRAVLSGDTEIMEESFAYMAEALILAVIMVYLILAAQFESFVDPLSIMLALPLAIVGMAAMLLITGDHVSIISLIGLIMLMGLVTKNAILLVDYTKTLRRRGLERREALIEAGRTRLRPIMMTTLAMIFGMLPTALAIGSGAEMRAPMGRGVIGGLITSTMLTLIVVPVMYSILDDLVMRRRRRAAGAAESEPVGASASGRESHAAVSSLSKSPGSSPASGGPVIAGFVALFLVAASFTTVAAQKAVRMASSHAATKPPKTPSTADTAAASPAKGDTLTLTLADALKIAMGQNRDLRNAEEYGHWVHGRYVEERAAALPHLSLDGNAARQRDESQQAFFGGLFPAQQDVWTAQAGLTQAIFTWGQIGAAIHGAREAIAEADDRMNTVGQEVVFTVTRAFYDIVLMREVKDIADQNLVQKERHLDETTRKYAEGTATDYDVLAAQVAVDNSKPEVIRATNAINTARDRLRFLLAIDAGEVEAVGELTPADSASSPPDYDTALATALEHRPELSSLEHRMAVARDFIKIYGADNKPRLDLAAGYGWRQYDLGDMKADGEFWSVGLNLSFPIFDGMRTKGKVAQARSDARTIENDGGALRDQIALEVRTALHAVVEAREIESAIAGTVQQADRLLAMAQAGYDLGAKTHLEVEDALLNLMMARVDLARARRDRLVAEAGLKKVQGILVP